MKNYYAVFCFLLVWSSISAQIDIALPATATDRIRAYDPSNQTIRLDEGESFTVTGYHLVGGTRQVNYRIEKDGQTYTTANRNVFDAVEIDYSKASLNDLWSFQYINSDGLIEVGKHGRDPELRAEVEQEYLELENSLETYDDPFLLDYLNQMLMRVFPGEVPVKQAVNLQVKLFNGSEPWSFAFSSGKIYLSTGLLANLNSEAELMAVLAVEVAHIYFDHSVNNYRLQEVREARAKFWTGLLTLAALAAETAVAVDAANDGNYDLLDYQFFGVFTESVFLLSSSVASAILDRLGMKYTREQTIESDRTAELVLRWHGKDESALHAALSRIDEYYKSSREYALNPTMIPYPNLNYRLKNLPDNTDKPAAADADYLRRCAALIAMTAWQEYREGEFDIAQQLIDRLVENGLASVDDQVLRSVLLRRASLDKGDMMKALAWLDEGEQSARAVPLELHLERSVLHNRMGNTAEARASLIRYREALLQIVPLQEKRLRWVEQMLERL